MTTTLDALTAVRAALAQADELREQADQAVRDAVVAAHRAGVPQTVIAETAGVTRQTIARWIA